MAVNLAERYGFVPKAVFPETHHSSNTSRLDELLTHKLREYALVLRRLRTATRTSTHAEWLQSARSVKAEQMSKIYDIVVTCLGAPPMPDAKFAFEYRDSAGKVRRIESTPLEFARKHAAPFNPADHISLINDPRNKYGELYTVKHLGNVCAFVLFRAVLIEQTARVPCSTSTPRPTCCSTRSSS